MCSSSACDNGGMFRCVHSACYTNQGGTMGIGRRGHEAVVGVRDFQVVTTSLILTHTVKRFAYISPTHTFPCLSTAGCIRPTLEEAT